MKIIIVAIIQKLAEELQLRNSLFCCLLSEDEHKLLRFSYNKEACFFLDYYWRNRSYTVFENHPKCRIWIFQFWHFPPIFVLLKLTCLVTLFHRKLQVFKNFCPVSLAMLNETFSVIFKHCLRPSKSKKNSSKIILNC